MALRRWRVRNIVALKLLPFLALRRACRDAQRFLLTLMLKPYVEPRFPAAKLHPGTRAHTAREKSDT